MNFASILFFRLAPIPFLLACAGNLAFLAVVCHGEKPYQPKLSDGKSPDFHDFPMGVLSATGRLHEGEREIVVRHVGKGGVAESGGLQVGDRILSIDGQTPKLFSMSTDTGLEGPQEMLGKALETACSSKSNLLQLQVRRGEENMTMKLKVPASPVFASTFPQQCPKSWQASSSAILLAEYQLATGDKTFFSDLKKCCDLLAGRVSGNGRMGHYYAVPYEGTGLVIINVQAHLAWALAAKCGYKVDRKAWDRSMVEIRKSVGPKTGGIGYSSRVPDYPDIPARTGAMTIALSVADEESKLAKGLANSLVRHQARMRHAHSMTSIGLIFGMAGIKSVDPKAHQEVMRKWIPYLELCRTSLGTAAYFGSKRNYAGDAYLGYHPIGNATVALMLASADAKLFIHGGTKRNWLGKP